MKRVVLIALSVALFASVANAQTVPGTAELWIQAEDGTDLIEMAVSETAIIQLWMEYTAPMDGSERLMVGMDAMLQMKPDPPLECIEVVGWRGPGVTANEYGPWGINGTFFTKSRGMLDEAPFDGIPDYTGCGNIDPYYMYIATVYGPYDNTTGLPPNAAANATGEPGGDFGDMVGRPYAMLLDEIIIHCNCDTGTTLNKVFFQSGLQTPKFFELTYYSGEWVQTKYDFLMGTGSEKANALKVHCTPEPGSLALLAFGGLAAMRRRR